MPFPPRISVFPYQFLLLGIYAYHRLASTLEGQDLLIDMAKLGIPVRMLSITHIFGG